jgi:hypothetical protein
MFCEAGQSRFVLRDLLGQHLDRHVPVQPLVMGAVDLAHAPCPQGSEDLVASETSAGFETHHLYLC